MIHVGDITKLKGFDLPPVDCVTGGSPCQDLSIAGKRTGLAGERSGLFMEQVRVIKELRDNDRNRGRTDRSIRPRFMVWENVPGVFSSNHGADFAAVLHETVKIAEPEAPAVPIPSGGWPRAGCLMGAGWSVAWRVHDAQFWGVPQRRKRIALVADFGGHAAPEVLFERKGVSGDSAPGAAPRKETAGGAGTGADGASCSKLISEPILLESNQNNATVQTSGISTTLTASMGMVGGYVPMVLPAAERDSRSAHTAYCIKGNAVDRDTAQNGCWVNADIGFTLDATDRHAIYDARGNGSGNVSPTLTGDHQSRVTDYTALCIGNGQTNNISMSEQANSLDTMHDQQAVYIPHVSHSLKAKGNCNFREDSETYVSRNATVRRLTPLECERLQGYPDGWTDIGEWTDSKGKRRQCTDTARYKALGNSIALPFWFWLLRRISALYPRPATLGSLFDGIGGFPLCWERCNGPGTALWASEIDEFAIAVTKRRFCNGQHTREID